MTRRSLPSPGRARHGGGPRIGSTRARQAVLAGGAGVLALGLSAALVPHSVLAAGLVGSHEDTRVYLDGLEGREIGLAATSADRAAGPNDPTPEARGRIGLKLEDVKANGLCALATHELPLVGQVSTIITAGEPVDGKKTGQDRVLIDVLTLDVEDITGDAQDAKRLELGQSAESVPGEIGATGGLGLSVEEMTFNDLELTAGQLQLSSGADMPRLRIRTVNGPVDRSDCP